MTSTGKPAKQSKHPQVHPSSLGALNLSPDKSEQKQKQQQSSSSSSLSSASSLSASSASSSSSPLPSTPADTDNGLFASADQSLGGGQGKAERYASASQLEKLEAKVDFLLSLMSADRSPSASAAESKQRPGIMSQLTTAMNSANLPTREKTSRSLKSEPPSDDAASIHSDDDSGSASEDDVSPPEEADEPLPPTGLPMPADHQRAVRKDIRAAAKGLLRQYGSFVEWLVAVKVKDRQVRFEMAFLAKLSDMLRARKIKMSDPLLFLHVERLLILHRSYVTKDKKILKYLPNFLPESDSNLSHSALKKIIKAVDEVGLVSSSKTRRRSRSSDASSDTESVESSPSRSGSERKSKQAKKKRGRRGGRKARDRRARQQHAAVAEPRPTDRPPEQSRPPLLPTPVTSASVNAGRSSSNRSGSGGAAQK